MTGRLFTFGLVYEHPADGEGDAWCEVEELDVHAPDAATARAEAERQAATGQVRSVSHVSVDLSMGSVVDAPASATDPFLYGKVWRGRGFLCRQVWSR